MILKFDSPITIQEARFRYNDSVSFISSPDSYPQVQAIEFQGDPKLIFKRDAIEPKITKKLNRIIAAYERKITRIWNRAFKDIKEHVQVMAKDAAVSVAEEQKNRVHDTVTSLVVGLSEAAEKPYYEAFEIGKLRGQVISGQEIDADATPENETEVDELLDANSKYLSGFGNDITDSLDDVLGQSYPTHDALLEAIDNSVKTPKFSRALMYAAAILGAAVAGTLGALKEAKPEQGHRVMKGGIWVLHPDEGKGGEVCSGCEENSGRWFTLDDFRAEYRTNECLTRCRCDLRYGEQIIAPGDLGNE